MSQGHCVCQAADAAIPAPSLLAGKGPFLPELSTPPEALPLHSSSGQLFQDLEAFRGAPEGQERLEEVWEERIWIRQQKPTPVDGTDA